VSESTVIFIEGVAAVGSAVIVFAGSVWLLLMLVTGARLAYFITATVTLGVLLIMGAVWSITEPPLGPAGEPASWSSVAVADTPQEADFGPAAEYPDGPWQTVNRDDSKESAKASELESEAGDALEEAISKDQVTTFDTASDALANADETKFLEQDGTLYGGVTFEDTEKTKSAVVFASYDPGNPLSTARQITGGVFLLFVLHLILLSRIEKKAKSTVAEPA
jgi:hypothetical protein